MSAPSALLARLEAIARALEASGHALALIGLGSAGLEIERLDAYSDLDFFAVVENGHKSDYIENLEWLSSICPIAYRFRNTGDGYKVLFQDGIFCEFAVFEQPELRTIPFAPGRIVWKRPQIGDSLAGPAALPALGPAHTTAWLVDEVLTTLYVGLGRYRRGEKLSAARLIQHHAVDRIMELSASIEQETAASRDMFANERRFEQRFPHLAQHLPRFIQGYERSCKSAQAILTFLEEHFEVNPAMADAVRRLAGDGA